MSLEQYKNIKDIRQSNKQQRGVRYLEVYNKQLPSVELFSNFGLTSSDVVELHVYDDTGKYIKSNPNILTHIISDVSPLLENKPTVVLNPQQDLIDLEVSNGRYKVVYNFIRNIFGGINDISRYLFIENISEDRTELRVFPADINNQTFTDNIISFSNIRRDGYQYWPDCIMNFSKNKILPVINWALDTVTTSEYPYSLLLKLYEPLSTAFKEKDLFWISIEVSDPVIDNVFLDIPIQQIPSNRNYLKSANFNLDITQKVGYETNYKSWDDVLSTNPTSSQQLINLYLSDISGSIKGIELNIDYSNYHNFVNFSSAEERLGNFKYKLELLEDYNTTIYNLQNMLSGSTGASVLTAITQSQDKINQIVTSFDGFENHLYYNSGSNYIDSFGFVLDRTWPKQNSTKPYVLYATTSSIAETWFVSESAAAQEYDRYNRNSLIQAIPFHIREKENVDGSYTNASYMLFVNMIAQHFDILWLYINQLTESYNKEQKLTQGIAKDLIYHFVESMGWDLDDGVSIDGLWEYTLGMDASGSYYTGSDGLDYITPQDRQKEIWKRLFNNLPNLLKQKGTARGIKALISCYGVPSTILRIKEYGGATYQDSEYEIDKYSYALQMYGSQSIETPEMGDIRTIQLRFNTMTGSNIPLTQSILSTPSWSINLLHSSSVWGKLEFDTITSSMYPIYDGETWNIMLVSGSSDTSVYLYKFRDDRFTHMWSGSNSLILADENITIGTNQVNTNFFTGSIQEFRIWNLPLSSYEFEAYCKNPESYFTNSPTSSYSALTLRYPFNVSQSHFSASVDSSSIYDYNPSQVTINYGTASNYGEEIPYISFIEKRRIKTPKYWGNKINSEKIRFESSSLDGNLSSMRKAEKIVDTRTFDSPKLGINFSPIDMINEDIFAQMGDFILDNYIGNPTDQFNPNYPDLEDLKEFYFSKYPSPNNIYDYIRYVKIYDASLFKQIRKLLPERDNSIVGLSFESHVLERPKYQWRPITVTSQSLSDIIDYNILPFGENIITETSLSVAPDVDVGSKNIGEVANIGEYLTYFSTSGSYIDLQGKVDKIDMITLDSQPCDIVSRTRVFDILSVLSSVPTSLSQTIDAGIIYQLQSGSLGAIIDTPRDYYFNIEREKYAESRMLYSALGVTTVLNIENIRSGELILSKSDGCARDTTDIISMTASIYDNYGHKRYNEFINLIEEPTDSRINTFLRLNKIIVGSTTFDIDNTSTALYQIQNSGSITYQTKQLGYDVKNISGSILLIMGNAYGDITNEFQLNDSASYYYISASVTESVDFIISHSYYDSTNTIIVPKQKTFKTGMSNRVLFNNNTGFRRNRNADIDFYGRTMFNPYMTLPLTFLSNKNNSSIEEENQFYLYVYREKTLISKVFRNFYDEKKYKGFLNTSDTTYDKKSPVEVYKVNFSTDINVGDKLDNIEDNLQTV